jgi:hypothetical protein
MPTFPLPFPEWKERIDSWFENDFSAFTEERIAKEYDEIVGVLPLVTTFFSLVGKPLWRVRANVLDSEHPQLISTYSHPPPNLTAVGRANTALNPVFYCTSSPYAAIREARLNDNKRGFLTEWRLSDCPKVSDIPGVSDMPAVLEHPETVPRLSMFIGREYWDRAKLEGIDYAALLDSQRDGHEYVTYLCDLLAGAFTKKAFPLTAYLSHLAIYEPRNLLDGLVYPSNAGGVHDLNLAFQPNFVHSHLRLRRIYWFEFVENVDQYHFKLVFRAKSIPFRSHILSSMLAGKRLDEDADIANLLEHGLRYFGKHIDCTLDEHSDS